MGFGKKKTDAAQILGRLSVMPWDEEPLTEIQPLRDDLATPSELNNQRTAISADEPDRK
jgi:hypothetical protein